METTTGAIILLFVFVIFSSLGGSGGDYNRGNVANNSSVPSLADRFANSGKTRNAVAPVQSGSVAHDYASGSHAKTSINNFICRFRKPSEAQAIADSIMRHARKYDVNPKLVTALIRRESRFNPRAISSVGARGLGQLLPSTAKGLGVTNSFDIDQNVMGTTRYMKYLLDRFKNYSNRVAFALASYLEGPNAVAKKQGYSRTTGAYIKDIIEIYHKI